MNDRLQDALENCLTRMDKGETLESVLLRYPNLKSQLSPLLKTALRARSGSRESLPQSVLARQRGRGLAMAAGLRGEEIPPVDAARRLADFHDSPFGDRHPGLEQ